MISKFNTITLVISTILHLFLPFKTNAQAGSLDLTFGTEGKVTTSFEASDARGYAMALQSDGKIVVAGLSEELSGSDFALVRYNKDGSLDLNFDFDGKVTTDFGGRVDYIFSIVIQIDGKILVAGQRKNDGDSDIALARYNQNGSLDLNFDTDGKLTTDLRGEDDVAYSLGVQADGKILVTGVSQLGSQTDLALVRYNPNGSLDNSFDSDGHVITDIGGLENVGYALAIQSDGKILVAGDANRDFALVRYNDDGSLDHNFGIEGKVTTDIMNSFDIARSIAIQSDGKILVAGMSEEGFSFLTIVRYNADGSLDQSFDTDGKAITNKFGSDANSIAIQNDGKILVTGSGPNTSFALLRFNKNGSLDLSFDGDGKTSTAFENSSFANAIAIQSDEKILVSGYSQIEAKTNFVIVRYNNATITSTMDLPMINTRIEVFPNPFSNSATIQCNHSFENATISVYNLNGRLVKELCPLNTANGKTIELTRDNLPKGIYFIHLQKDGQIMSTNKIVITD